MISSLKIVNKTTLLLYLLRCQQETQMSQTMNIAK